MTRNKKGAALLIVLVLIAVISALVAVTARSAIAGMLFTTNTVDNMTAEVASKAGIEIGLLKLKNGQSFPSGDEIIDSTINSKYNIASSTSSSIVSIGKMGRVQVKHTLSQKVEGTLPTPPVKNGLRLFIDPLPGSSEVRFGDMGKFLETSLGCDYTSANAYISWTTDINQFDNIYYSQWGCDTFLSGARSALVGLRPELRYYDNGTLKGTAYLYKDGTKRGKFAESSIWILKKGSNYYYRWSWTSYPIVANSTGQGPEVSCDDGNDCLRKARADLANQNIEIRFLDDEYKSAGVLFIQKSGDPKSKYVESTIGTFFSTGIKYYYFNTWTTGQNFPTDLANRSQSAAVAISKAHDAIRNAGITFTLE